MSSARWTPRQMVAQVEDVLLRHVYPQRKQLAALSQVGSLGDEDVTRTIRRLTEAAAQTLGVERASVWRLRPDGGAIECVDLYQHGPGRHESGAVISSDMCPSYFKALATEKVIDAHDVDTDPRTAELCESYLQPLGITSMLDAPAFVRGKAMAVICHEHVGPARRWEFWEQLVASTFADFVATVFEAQSRTRDAAERRAAEQELERQVAERTRALSESEQNLQALLDAAPIPLILTRASDHTVVYGNARAAALFEVPREQVTGQLASSFWVDENDRQAFLTGLLSKGRVDDVQVRLRGARGRIFWVRLNAQAVRFRGELSLLAGMVEITEQRQAQQNLREIFESAPVALVLTRLSDRVVLDSNQRAASLFDVGIGNARGRMEPDFWVEAESRERLREATRAAGRVDGFEAELKTNAGKRFWAELSAGIVQFDGEPALLVGATDITPRKRAEEALRRSERTLRTLLDAAPNPLVVTRLGDGVLRYVNNRAAAMFELTVDECVGRRAPDFYVDAADRQNFIEILRRDGHVEGFTARLRTSSGRPLWVLMNAKTFDLEGEEVFMVGFAELSAQKELEEKLRTLATTDELTGVCNRRRFFELAAAELERAGRYGRRPSLAMLDIDHFKDVNDQLGHAAGDATLRALTAVVRKEVRSIDVVARIGGEEFALLFPETGLSAAQATVERVRRTIEDRPLIATSLGRRLTVSLGVAEHRPGESLEELLKRADAGLYQAKSGGRNRVVAVG